MQPPQALADKSVCAGGYLTIGRALLCAATAAPTRVGSCTDHAHKFCANYAQSKQFTLNSDAECKRMCSVNPRCTGGYRYALSNTCYHFGVLGSAAKTCGQLIDNGSCNAFFCTDSTAGVATPCPPTNQPTQTNARTH